MNKEYWWLSFSDEKNLGIAIVEMPKGSHGIEAIKEAHRLGINPGGEVLHFLLETEEQIQEGKALGIGKLIPREEMIKKGYVSSGLE